ncbi:E3 ubiquitin-protein ligase RNF14-like [Engraulis encrasicolus]|uniref:E3 ubiquitin-protein ligase RNF14-like n=1 Tax=Engraulis encrasicolus TaxID=184585 RepID=UPI002FD5FD10
MDTAQEDELLAMGSILGPEEFRQSETNSGGINDNLQGLADNFTICHSSLQTGESQREYDFQYLPPLTVQFELPRTYPSQSCPVFTLGCQWLRHNQLSKVCEHLYEMWQESGGGEVLFSWYQFLKEDLLDFLSISSPWEVPSREHPEQGASSPYALDTSSDPRVTASCSTHTDDLLQVLLEHNQKMKWRVFEDQIFQCSICFSGKPGSECHRFEPCEHVFCKDCTANLFTIGIEEGRVLQFGCPNSDCDSVPSLSEVKALVGSELFCRYDQLLLQKSLDRMAGVVYCPRPNCSCPVALEPGDNWALCPSCAFAFCTKCREASHGVDRCPQDPRGPIRDPKRRGVAEDTSDFLPLPKDSERIQELWNDYHSGSKMRKQLLEERYGKKTLQTGSLNYALSGSWIKKNTKKCPSCSVDIEKNEGCNSMYCTACRTSFCWCCLKLRH